jgi:hypothetical protein
MCIHLIRGPFDFFFTTPTVALARLGERVGDGVIHSWISPPLFPGFRSDTES